MNPPTIGDQLLGLRQQVRTLQKALEQIQFLPVDSSPRGTLQAITEMRRIAREQLRQQQPTPPQT